MTSVYVPQAGTIAARALAHLRALPADTEIANGPLADALGMNHNTLNVCLDTAARNGVLVRNKKEGRVYWRIGPKAPAPPPAPADDVEADAVPDLAVKQVRVDASTAPAPIAGLTRQSWCPVVQTAGDASSLDEPPAPPPPSPAPPLGLGWRAPRMPVFLADAPAAGPEPGPAAGLTETPPDDPDFREVDRAPALPTPETPPKGAEAAQAPVPPCGRDDATPNDGIVPQRKRDEFRCALWSSGELHIELYPGNFMLLTKAETEQLVHYLERMAEVSA